MKIGQVTDGVDLDGSHYHGDWYSTGSARTTIRRSQQARCADCGFSWPYQTAADLEQMKNAALGRVFLLALLMGVLGAVTLGGASIFRDSDSGTATQESDSEVPESGGAVQGNGNQGSRGSGSSAVGETSRESGTGGESSDSSAFLTYDPENVIIQTPA